MLHKPPKGWLLTPPKSVNGFKLMNDEKEMLNLILPNIVNYNESAIEKKL